MLCGLRDLLPYEKNPGTFGEGPSKLWKYTRVPEALENSQQRGMRNLFFGRIKCSELGNGSRNPHKYGGKFE